jgi:hypothetical protein
LDHEDSGLLIFLLGSIPTASAQSGGGYDLSWYVIGSGGGTSGNGLPRRYDTQTDGADFLAQLALCYDDAELLVASIEAAREAELHAYRYTGGGEWLAYSQVDTANNVVTATNVTAGGVWGLGVEDDHPTQLGLSSLLAIPRPGARLPAALAGLGLLGAAVWRLRRRRR